MFPIFDIKREENNPFLNRLYEIDPELKELTEKRVAREILTMIESICFSEEYTTFRVNQGSNGQRDLIITKIKEQYLKILS